MNMELLYCLDFGLLHNIETKMKNERGEDVTRIKRQQ